MLRLVIIKRTDPRLLENMANHYSRPKGFVGRNICYAVMFNDVYYGAIVGGSATLHLPGRHDYLQTGRQDLNSIVNNIFFHIEKVDGKYPLRNFSQVVLKLFIKTISEDWELRYGDKVIGFESLVELPRTGEIYSRSGWHLVGQTKGYTCKRGAGKGTDEWSGKRIWDVSNLRPKHVFVYKLKE